MSSTPEDKRADNLDKMAAEFMPTEEDKSAIEESGLELLKKAEFPWDEALDSYDPTFPNYTPSTDALHFFNVAGLIAGEDFEVQNSLAQYFMIDVLFDNVTNDMYPYSKEINDTIDIDNDRIAICCSRGLSKSTLITNFMFMYIAITGKLPNHGPQRFWLALGASSKGHARNMAISLRAICEESKYMNDSMEYMRFTETEAEFLRKGNGSERSRYFCIRFMGVFTPTRGQKSKYNDRLDVAVLDDCLPSHAAAYSKTIMATLETAIHSDLGNALKANGGKIWNIFTPFNFNEPNTSSILNGSFTPVLLPVAKAFANSEKVVKEEIVSSWPAMHTKRSIYKMWTLAKKSKTLGLFMQERMLRLTSGAERLVPDDEIQWCDMKLIGDNISAYNVYITTDYTTTSGENSDFSGIATWAVSNNDDWFLLDLSLCKRTVPEQYAYTLDQVAIWRRKGKYVEVGVELDGNQTAHIHGLEAMMAKRGMYVQFAKPKDDPFTKRKGILSKATGVKKHDRFRLASVKFHEMKVWFPEHLRDTRDMIEMVKQIEGATHSRFSRADDGPDLCSMAFVSMNYLLPSVALEAKKSSAPKGFWDEPDELIRADGGY